MFINIPCEILNHSWDPLVSVTIIAITGIASTLARAIVPRLLSEPAIEKIIGVDIRKPEYLQSEKIEFWQVDVRNIEALKKAFERIDILLHLAFIVIDNIPDRATIDAINITGSMNVFQAAVTGGARKIIHLSSVAAYGMFPDTPPQLVENDPLRGGQNVNFYYPYAKAIVEEYLNTFEEQHPTVCVTRFRPHVIAGPKFAAYTNNLNIILNPLRKRHIAWMFKPKNADSMLLQFTHEEDLAEAIMMAIRQDLPGAFNIASMPIDHAKFLNQRGVKVRWIPWCIADFGIACGSLFSRRLRQLRAWIVGIKYQIIVSSNKLKSRGFSFKFPTTDAIIDDLLNASE